MKQGIAGRPVMYAEIFIRTRSLYLPILIHFLVNGTVDVWFHGLDGRTWPPRSSASPSAA